MLFTLDAETAIPLPMIMKSVRLTQERLKIFILLGRKKVRRVENRGQNNMK